MKKPLLAGCLLLCFALLLPQTRCSGARSRAQGKRLIILGIDGMDPGFLERHWDLLPNLARLRGQGEFKRLATTIPPQSPVAWSTFITGRDPGGHGIYDFVHRNPLTMLPFSSMGETIEPHRTLALGPYVLPLSKGRVQSFRKGKAFWQILSEQSIPVTVIRMPTNFPPVECEGRSLAGMGTPDMRGTFGTFAYYTDDPEETTREVPGGRIVRVDVAEHRVVLAIEGPVNTLRQDRPRSSVTLSVDVDPSQPVGRFQAGDTPFILREGEWSGWIRVRFPLISGLKSAAGMFRVYAKKIRPQFRLYVSPINIDPAEPELPISTPESYSGQLAEAVGPFYTQGIAEDTAAWRQGVFNREEYLQQSRNVAEEQLRLLQYGLENFQEGLLFFHFLGIDQNSHMLWGKYDKDLLETYRLVDRAIGRVMERLGNGTLIVMSDHGFTSFDRAVHLNTWLWREGFLALDETRETGADELFARLDWSKTQDYSLGLNGLYMNLLGREHNGTVAPGSESEEVLRRLTERLRNFRDPDTGQPVVADAYSPRSLFQAGTLDTAPDLIVGYTPGFRSSWQTALGAVPSAIIVPNTDPWIGDHCIAPVYVPGVLLSNRRSRLPAPHLQDLTVTVLSEFGIPRAEGMIGQPIY